TWSDVISGASPTKLPSAGLVTLIMIQDSFASQFWKRKNPVIQTLEMGSGCAIKLKATGRFPR
ncbi:hypothetical protein, partial [Burkholderia anthina]|uniref:hypothetical protein n=1 Tax=Burkholderia anthina TaxID=179879 RepID=UPI001ABBD570